MGAVTWLMGPSEKWKLRKPSEKKFFPDFSKFFKPKTQQPQTTARCTNCKNLKMQSTVVHNPPQLTPAEREQRLLDAIERLEKQINNPLVLKLGTLSQPQTVIKSKQD